MKDSFCRDSLQRRVNRGVKFLDKEVPDWRNKINIFKLNMGSMCNCIQGQLVRNTQYGGHFFGITESSYYGFYCANKNMPRLKELWIKAIRS